MHRGKQGGEAVFVRRQHRVPGQVRRRRRHLPPRRPRVRPFLPSRETFWPPDRGLPRRGRGTPETRRAGHFPPGRSVSPSWLSTLRLLEQVPGVPPVSLWRPLGPLSWSPGGINTILAAPPCLSPVRPPQPPSSPLAWLERPPLGLSPHAADVLHTHALHTTVHSTVEQEQGATRAERGQWTRRESARQDSPPSCLPCTGHNRITLSPSVGLPPGHVSPKLNPRPHHFNLLTPPCPQAPRAVPRQAGAPPGRTSGAAGSWPPPGPPWRRAPGRPGPPPEPAQETATPWPCWP